MADTHVLQTEDMNSLFGQLKAMVLVALESAGNDGKIDSMEAVRLASLGVGLVQSIVAMIQRNHTTKQTDSLHFVAANSQVHLPA
jgi:hypothetical protein